MLGKLDLALALMTALAVATAAGAAEDKSGSGPPADSVGKTKDPAAEAIASEIQAVLAQSPEEMVRSAQQMAAPLLASLRYGPTMAVAQTREKRLEQHRMACLAEAERLAEQRTATRAQLNEELAQVQQRYGHDAQRRQAESVTVALAYRDRLQRQKEAEDACRSQAQKAEAKLAEVRLAMAKLERSRRQCEEDYRHRLHRWSIPSAALDLEVNGDLPAAGEGVAVPHPVAKPGGSSPQQSQQTLDEILKGLDALVPASKPNSNGGGQP